MDEKKIWSWRKTGKLCKTQKEYSSRNITRKKKPQKKDARKKYRMQYQKKGKECTKKDKFMETVERRVMTNTGQKISRLRK